MADDDSVKAFHEHQRRSRLAGDVRDSPFYGLGKFFGVLTVIAFWVAVLYVAAHFIIKYW